MRLQTDSTAFAQAVAWAARSLPNRPSVPVLAGIRLEAPTMGDTHMSLSSFDYEVSARASVAVRVDAPGSVLVPGRLLAEIVRSLPADTVEFALDGNHIRIEAGRTVFTVPILALEDHPRLPEVPEQLGSVASPPFASGVRQVAVAASKDDTLPILTGIHVEFSTEKLRLVTTDRYRISVRDLWWQTTQPDAESSVLVPARSLLDVARELPGAGNVGIALTQTGDTATMIGLTGSDWHSTVRALEGPYVNYESRFPEDYAAHGDLRVSDLVDAVKRVALVAERHAPLRLTFSDGSLKLRVGTPNTAQAAEAIDVEYSGEEMTVAFSPQFLLDGLTAVETPTARISLTTPTRPAVLHGVTEQGEQDPTFRYLTMPLRLPQ